MACATYTNATGHEIPTTPSDHWAAHRELPEVPATAASPVTRGGRGDSASVNNQQGTRTEAAEAGRDPNPKTDTGLGTRTGLDKIILTTKHGT